MIEKNITSLQDMLLKSANYYSDKLALKDLKDTPIKMVTYSELLDQVLRFGTALQNLGIKERTPIAIISENRVQWGIAYLTCAVFNYIVVPIDNHLHENEVINILHESNANVIVYNQHWSDTLNNIDLPLKNLSHFINMDILEDSDSDLSMVKLINNTRAVAVEQLPTINPNELFELIFTSGSIGQAKGVMLSHSNLCENLMSMVRALPIYPTDRFLSMLPIHHTYECTCGFLCPIYSGASVHYSRSFKYLLEDIASEQPTLILGVPLIFDKIFKRIWKTIKENKFKDIVVNKLITFTNLLQKIGLNDLKKYLFKQIHDKFGGHIRVLIVGGAAPDPEVIKGFNDFGLTMVQGYGLTETAPIVALNRLENPNPLSAGQPLDCCAIKIENPDSEGIGEICVKGGNVMLGYYKNEELTKDVIKNGWFYTGDLGYLDENNFLYIKGRKKNVIIAKNGKNVFPEEIEDLLNKNEFILESVVYGEKDEKEGEIIVAQIVPDTEMFIKFSDENNLQLNEKIIYDKISEIVKATNNNLTSYKQIRKFYIRDTEFEKTTTRKIKRYLINKK
ncbi:MAG TPA: AMP-binding protein [Ignavibacteriales bacterium]|nr:AMP-binding protein [Ignavibacteriales bacterium]HPD68363.1 AMP-binding protein [Ignavibacteriales bacterium]HRR17875.1 AMP-binding protein [Ignavibacteriales bacterium]HRT99874.1 AMP-binding protein [Ignavibacteriales bacterium]